MLGLLGLVVCLITTFYLVQLIKSFGYMSTAELKRRSQLGDKQAKRVYQARRFKLQIWVFLWGLLALILAAMVIIIDRFLPFALALVIDVVLLVSVHVFLPWARWPAPNLKLASQVGPHIARVLKVFQPILKYLDSYLGNWIETELTVRIHSKEELLENLRRLPGDLDKIGKDELRIAMHALTFGDKQIKTIMTPKSVMQTVSVYSELSPALLTELHDSGFSRFPVISSGIDDFVGVFYLKDINYYRGSRLVEEQMRQDVYYVNEETNLDQVLNAFLRTHHHLFIVVNQHQQTVGVITIEDVLEQILGRAIIDEFDKYEDLQVVANQQAKQVKHQRADDEHQHLVRK